MSGWVRSGLFLTGSFAVAYNLAVAIHEVGHVIAGWLMGGEVRAFFLHPFSVSYVDVVGDSYPLVTHSGGPVFSVVAAAVLLGVAGKRASPPWGIARLTGVTLLAATGIYLALGAMLGFGDSVPLMAAGVPGPLLILIGLGSGLASLNPAMRLLALLGVTGGMRPAERLGVLGLGVTPYFLAIVGCTLLYDPGRLGGVSVVALSSLLVAASVALASGAIGQTERPPPPSHTSVWIVLFLGLSVVLGELIAFG